MVTKHANTMCGPDLDDCTITALKLHRFFITAVVPRILDGKRSEVWYLFTDACFGPGSFSGIGAVLVDSHGTWHPFFSHESGDDLLKQINVTSGKTTTFELEFFAIFCSLFAWRGLLSSAQVVVYACAYNECVGDALMACQTESKNGEPILEACLKLEYELGLNLWMSRVPTDSKIAGDPSRRQCDYVCKQLPMFGTCCSTCLGCSAGLL